MLGLLGFLIEEWNWYLHGLKLAHIRLTTREDEIVWDLHTTGIYTPKVGYVQLSLDRLNGQVAWCWTRLWKFKCPGKAKLLFWLILENKVPTWENLQKCQFNGSGWCSLWKSCGETSDHLFLDYPFSRET